MKSFLYQINKKELEKNIEITSFFIDDKQKIIEKKASIPYHIYLKKNDFDSLNFKKTTDIVQSKSILHNKDQEEVIELSFKDQDTAKSFHSILREEKIPTYEQDLPAEHRYLISKPNTNTLLTLKYLSVDIETIGIGAGTEIVLLSTHSPQSKNESIVYVNTSGLKPEALAALQNKKYSGFKAILLDNEKELLTKFKEQILSFKPQLILGWNVIDFDFKIIKYRMEELKIDFRFTDYEGDFRLRINNDFFKDSTLTGPGILFFDVIALLKTNFISFDDYKLNTVAKAVLKDEKIGLDDDEMGDNKIEAITKMYYENTSKLIEYNFKDSELTSSIVEELQLIELMQQRSLITKTPLFKVKSPIASLDIMYLEKLHKENLVADTNFSFADSTPIEGAFVLSPTRGFYENIFVFDFKSLYPSIIMTFNIDPFSYDKDGEIMAPNGAKFDKKDAILPSLIKNLSKERDNAKKENDQTKSFALKTTMNSFYGAIASPKCRFYNKQIGEAITSFGREIIQKAIEFAKSKGHEAIYGDTDSCFVKLNDKFKNLEDKKEKGKKFENEMNKFITSWVEKEFEQKSYLDIELEKIFSHFFIASKKRYVGYDEITKKNMYVGMEAIRGDWTELAKTFQRDLVDLIFSNSSKEKIKDFILEYVDNLKQGKFDDKLIYKKKITKDLDKYTKMTPPHVKAAREIKDFKGRTVYYIMTKEGPRHISLVLKDTQYDYDHYIDKQLAGVSDDLLESIGIDFKDVLYKKKQKNLDSFF